MIKIYESIAARNNVTLSLKAGKATVRFEFEKGNISRGIRARYTTNDPFKQMVLEKNEAMGTLYRLAREIPENDSEQDGIVTMQQVSEEAKAAAQRAYDEVMARVLHDQKNQDSEHEDQKNQEGGSDTKPAESQAPKASSYKDMEFDDITAALIYCAEKWNVQVQTPEDAAKLMRKHKINMIIK